jgi:cellulose 1,4-beta-cellobiosidase
VLPTTPDFSITVGPAAQEVAPGGFATYTVAVTPLSGFAGTVNLSVSSESGFPTGITSGGFSPASISDTGSSTLTMDTTTSTVPYALSLTVTGTSGTITHTASTTLLVNLAAPASLAAIAGDAKVSLSWPASVGASYYQAKRATASGGPYQNLACPTTASFTDTSVVDGKTYYYVVDAGYTSGPNAGGESADSAEASATPQGTQQTPAAPTNLTAKGIKRAINLQWVQPTTAGVARNSVYRRLMNGGTYLSSPIATIGATTSYHDRAVSSGTSYCYVVTAISAGGQSSPSDEACAAAK